MPTNKMRNRKPGETKLYDSGKKFNDIYNHSDVYGDKLSEEKRKEINKNSADLNEAYYDFITDSYQNGWGNKFHFCGYQPTESWDTAQARHEHHLALMMEMKPNMRVLDLGCGVGGPAREMAIFTGAHITGLSNVELHIERGTLLTKEANLTDQVNFVLGTFSELPFEDNSFDMAFAIEALGCAPDMPLALSEVMRVLKPGGKLGVLDWVITDRYDDGNKEHRIIRGRIERHGAVPHMFTPKVRIEQLEEAGFDVLFDEDRATAKGNPVPWWYAIDYKHHPTWKDWSYSVVMLKPLYSLSRIMAHALYWVGLIPHSFVVCSETVGECVYSCRDGGKEGIFSPMHEFVAQKPGGKKV